ncbi:MAG: pilus assembly protein [Bryobacteraceae bacterium]|nr:pilus assembly protein [Bryobacteraceae bacterium]MDW8377701.1 TadE/TadG family type IV pilus assembly protein [Bryobacterales bacterium]
MKNQLGNVILEFAFGLSLLALLLAGSVDLGVALFRYNALQTALRNGAYYASMRTYDSATPSPSPSFQQAVANVVVYGTARPQADSPLRTPGLDPRSIEVRATFERGVPTWITVTVKSFPIDAMFAKQILVAKPSVTFPFLGRFAPPIRRQLASQTFRPQASGP